MPLRQLGAVPRLIILISALLAFSATSVSSEPDKTARTPAKQIFGSFAKPAPIAARAIGSYARGCLAGAKMLPVNGAAWQAMRLSRNRNWGHPALVAYVERLAHDAKRHDGWPGLLVGDMAQPWGGPMLTGHASHQLGLDADIWLKPMPDRLLTEREREDLSAVSMLGPDRLSVDPQRWSDRHVALLKRAVSYPEVSRVFVHPAIKKALCEAAGPDRAWLSKIRPWWGHHYHFHVRLACPADSATCVNQPPPGADDGCGTELDLWFKRLKTPPKPAKPAKPKPPLTLADLPKECAELAGMAEILLAQDAAQPGGVPDAVATQAMPAARKTPAPSGGEAAAETPPESDAEN